jgi:hypothetical protein
MAVDSSDLRPVLKTIQALATEKRLLESDVMGAYIERLGSPDDKQAYAGLLTNGALAMLQQPENQDLLPGAASLARKAVGLSVPGGQVAVNANYILGLATVLQLPGRDQPIMDGKSCELAEESRAILEEASTSLELGKSASEAVAQYIQMANQFRPRIESQVKAFCK